jgi:hypothetical protein
MRFKRILPPPGRSARWLGGATLSGFLVPALVAAIITLLGFYSVGSMLPRSVLWSEFGVFMVTLGVGAIIVAAAPIYALLAWSWRPIVLMLLFVLFLVAGFLPGVMAGRYVQFGALDLFSDRSVGLVEAITAYEHATGAPPAELAALVPEYLSSVPGTGMAIQSEYRYEPKAGPCPVRNTWHLAVHLSEFLSVYRMLYCPNQDYGWVDASRERRMFGRWMYDEVFF